MVKTIEVTERVVTNRKVELKLDHKAIIDMLNAHGFQVPDNANVTFDVPGGGDWSNMSLSVCAGFPITVSYEEVSDSHPGR